MQISNNFFVKICLLTLGLNLVACNLPSPQERNASAKSNLESTENETESDSATFKIESMAAKSTVLEPNKAGAFALPSAKIFNFSACLKDIYQNKPISGHKFNIEESNHTVTTDSTGCLSWVEKIEYNFLGQSQYIKIKRHVQGSGIHKGTRTVSFAINPWSHGENLSQILDLRNEDAVPNLIKQPEATTKALQGLNSENNPISRSLWLDEGRLFVTEKKMTEKGIDLLIELRGTPAIQLSKMNNELSLYHLTEGSFKVRMKLIHVYNHEGQEVHRLLAETADLDAKMQNGSLAISSLVSLPQLPTRGQIMLGLELAPIDAPKGLKGFNGIYVLGEYDQLKGTSFLKLATEVAKDKEFKIENYVNAKTDSIQANSDAYQKPKIEIAPLDFRFIRIGEEKTSTREVIYNIKACLRSGVDQKAARSTTFLIKKFRQSESEKATEISLKTDNNACVSWDETIQFKFFECQKYFKGFINFENSELGLNQKVEVLINPWEQNSTIGRDARYVENDAQIPVNCKTENRPKSQLILDSFSYNTISYKYNVDDMLNLHVFKKVQLKTEPRVLLYSSLNNGRSESQRLRDGIYLLRLVVVANKDYVQQTAGFVSYAEKIVNVLSGEINTEITFETQDLKALGNRSNILVELLPVDESKIIREQNNFRPKEAGQNLNTIVDNNSELETPTFIGPIVLNLDESTRPLHILDDADIANYFLKAQNPKEGSLKGMIGKIIQDGLSEKEAKHKTQQLGTNSMKYAAENNLSLVNISEMEASSTLTSFMKSNPTDKQNDLYRHDLRGILISRNVARETAKKLCSFWIDSLLPAQQKEKGGGFLKNYGNSFRSQCIQAAIKDPSAFFQIENRVLVKEVGESQYLKGYNQGLSVGTSFSVSNSTSTSFTKSIGVSSKIGISKKFLEFISTDIGLNISANWSTAEAKSSSNSFSVSAATSLMVQINSMKIHVKQFEQCAIVRLNPLLFVKDDHWFGRKDLLGYLNAKLNDDEKIQVMTKGIMICDGQVRKQDYDIIENYYLITQESFSTQMQDNGDERNRNFFITLRSTNDFNRFVLAIEGKSKMPKDSSNNEIVHKDVNETIENLFKLKGSASPAMYLLNDGPQQ